MKEHNYPYVCGILVAAGEGSRMEGISKQLHPLFGIPVIAYTIQSFLKTPVIKEIVLVCREIEKSEMEKIAAEYIKGIPYSVVSGGGQRQDSVFNGIEAASSESQFFAIHDGVRPLVKPQEITACVELAQRVGAAALGVRVKDTIKVVGADGVILSTPDRSSLYAIQTPQIFEAELYRSAMKRAIEEGKSYTDDCQLIENMGRTVSVCEGSYENIKITTREDIHVAKAFIMARKEEQ